jgi:AraC family transcriptional regulator, regulatory protein of adaptative response / methylated-DNA-[protein]-cysteine methyltransferase
MNIATLDSISGTANGTIRFAFDESVVGTVLVAKSKKGVCAIFLGDDRPTLVRELQNRFPQSPLVEGPADLQSLAAQVTAFVDTPAKALDLSLDLRGTAFQRRVWQALLDIPVGQTASYTEIAERIGSPKAVRAVAQACAANAIALAVPCHRVIGNDGRLSGYRWGVERKRALLKREAAAGTTIPEARADIAALPV